LTIAIRVWEERCVSLTLPSERAATDAPGKEPLPFAGRAAGAVYDRLREEIVALDLKPGTVINRQSLQDTFGFSSTPIRDALTRLAEEGLVQVVAQSATRVSLIDVGQAREFQFLRRALEQEAVETVCRSAERSSVIFLREIIEAQRLAAETSDLARFELLDREFHRRIFEAAGVAALHAMLRRQSGHIDRIRNLHLPLVGRMVEIVEDHAQIVTCLTSGDAGGARQAMRDHLSRSLAYAAVLKERFPGYFVG
jgi:GntR family transcriptional regulator, rspAB operon transcriptional repressor